LNGTQKNADERGFFYIFLRLSALICVLSLAARSDFQRIRNGKADTAVPYLFFRLKIHWK